MNLNDQLHYMMLAYSIAKTSPDTSNQNGAIVLANDGHYQQVGESCNRFPVGFQPRPEDLERPRKYSLIVHAEMGAVLNAERTRDCVLVCPWFACSMCARCIVESGIKAVIGHEPRMRLTPDRWQEEVQIGNHILASAGIQMIYLTRRLGLPFTIKVNGEDWQP